MKSGGKIITVGLCPCWDTACQVDGLDWGRHEVIASRSDLPAGKALNICRALAWMGQKSTAAGLWGRDDFQEMRKVLRPLQGQTCIKMTAVAGRTRQNITVADTQNNREMHLRSKSSLASVKALRKLKADLQGIVTKNSICVFAGAMPEEKLWLQTEYIMKMCTRKGASLVIDTSSPALKKIVDTGKIRLISPNVVELEELLDKKIKDTPTTLAKSAKRLLDKVEVVLISRGKQGAIVVTRDGLWQGQLRGQQRKVLSTVGCGDYLLAGFLKAMKQKQSVRSTLAVAIKAATAKAWGLVEQTGWVGLQRQIKVDVKPI